MILIGRIVTFFLLFDRFLLLHYLKLSVGFAKDASMISEFFLKTHWKMVLIGESGSGMFNHKDTLRAASWQLQLNGSKRWHLCAPSQDRHMYSPGTVDFFNPDYEKFPHAKNARCYHVVVKAGELLYYPPDFWHQTLNLETPSVALTGTLLTKQSYNDVANELRKQCNGTGKAFIFSPTDSVKLCEQLDRKCFTEWRRSFDGIDNKENKIVRPEMKNKEKTIEESSIFNSSGDLTWKDCLSANGSKEIDQNCIRTMISTVW
jgi:hypothetical protein